MKSSDWRHLYQQDTALYSRCRAARCIIVRSAQRIKYDRVHGTLTCLPSLYSILFIFCFLWWLRRGGNLFQTFLSILCFITCYSFTISITIIWCNHIISIRINCIYRHLVTFFLTRMFTRYLCVFTHLTSVSFTYICHCYVTGLQVPHAVFSVASHLAL